MAATLFINGRIFIGDGRVIDRGGVLVEGERITRVGRGDPPGPRGARTVSLEGCTLLPGFIDCHVHLCMDAALDTFDALQAAPDPLVALKGAEHALRTLRAGITSVRDLGGKNGVDLVLRDAVRNGVIPGPRMQAAGRMVCMTGGTGWPVGRQADGPDEVRKAVREELKAGADVLKIMATGGVLTRGVDPGSTQFTLEELAAGVEEAHKAGRRVASHAQGTEGVKNAIRAGVDSIEHGFFLDEEAVEMMVRRDVSFIPTLSVYTAADRAIEAGLPRALVDEYTSAKADHLASVRLAREAGVRVAMGTDAGTAFNLHGRNLTELTHLVDLGYTAMEALRAGTGLAAGVLGREDALGTIEPGKLADLVVVEGDPLEDIGLLLEEDKIRYVFKGGRPVPAEAGPQA